MEQIKLPGLFTLIDYTISHSQIIFRNEIGIENIDLIFYGVVYINSHILLKDVIVSVASNDEIEKFNIDIHKGFKLYKLHSEKYIFSIVAGICSVYKNKLPFGKINLDFSNEENKGILIYTL